MFFRDFVRKLKTVPEVYNNLQIEDLVRFCQFGGDLLLRAGRGLYLSETRSHMEYLFEALEYQIPRAALSHLWLHAFPFLERCLVLPFKVVKRVGLQFTRQIPTRFLYPPVKHCPFCDPNHLRDLPVKTKDIINGYLYGLDGIQSIRIVSLYCEDCCTAFRPTYYSHQGTRYFYTKAQGRDLEVIQVHQHYFMKKDLAEHFSFMQMLAHVSIFNLVNLYNNQHKSDESLKFKEEQSFGASMSPEVCRDGLEIHRLLYHFDLRNAVLTVPTAGIDSQRYLKAMKEQIDYWSRSGTEYKDHACGKCLYVSDENKAIRACVTDGVTIGHWCCSASSEQLKKIAELSNSPIPDGPCLNVLTSIHDRLCKDHQCLLKDECVVQPCTRTRQPEHDTCNDPEHVAISKQFHDRKLQNFTMTSKLSRPGARLPTDPSVHQNCWTAELDESTLVDVDEADRKHEAERYGGQDMDDNLSQNTDNQTNKKKHGRKPCMSRCRTHNDQLIVSTCGIILARRTFYRAEAPSAVKQFILDSFPASIPNLIFYDNTCNLVQHIWSNPEDAKAFKDVVIPVDVFHMCSHKESDRFCQEFTDPNKIPDLKKGGKWLFNSSAAELTNIWYGGFASICRGMHAIRYNFFLEEMVRLRNGWLEKKLKMRTDVDFITKGWIF